MLILWGLILPNIASSSSEHSGLKQPWESLTNPEFLNYFPETQDSSLQKVYKKISLLLVNAIQNNNISESNAFYYAESYLGLSLAEAEKLSIEIASEFGLSQRDFENNRFWTIDVYPGRSREDLQLKAISDVYNLVKNVEVYLYSYGIYGDQVVDVLAQVETLILPKIQVNPIYAFIATILGFGRSEETINSYMEIGELSARK